MQGCLKNIKATKPEPEAEQRSSHSANYTELYILLSVQDDPICVAR